MFRVNNYMIRSFFLMIDSIRKLIYKSIYKELYICLILIIIIVLKIAFHDIVCFVNCPILNFLSLLRT